MKSPACSARLVTGQLSKKCCFSTYKALLNALSKLGIDEAARQYFSTTYSGFSSTPHGYVRVEYLDHRSVLFDELKNRNLR